MPRSLLVRLSIMILLMLAALTVMADLGILGPRALPQYYFTSFDRYAVSAMVLVWLIVAFFQPRFALAAFIPDRGITGWGGVVIAAILLALISWAGAHLVMLNYPISRDEHMAVFDAELLVEGHGFALLAEQWSGFGKSLVPDFLLESPDANIMVSGYLPVNAVFKAGAMLLGDGALSGAILAGVGLIALFACCRIIFDDGSQPIWVVLAAYILSSQMLVTSMTPYAMTGHLALNLVWLALFLKDKWWSHGVAVIVGFAAMGLHQFVFHPLFAGPFILWLLWRKQWFAFGFYALAYGAGVLFWMSWSGFIFEAAGIAAADGVQSAGGAADFISQKVVPLLTSFDPFAVPLMLFNLARALSWNAAFVLPLVVIAWPLVRSRNPVVIALFAGIVLTLFAMTILLPYQGHGWGYRYIHGLIGSFALLAGVGYCGIAPADRPKADGAIAVMAAFSALILIPAGMISAHNFAKPHANLYQVIAAQDADFVIVDNALWPNATDEVRNRADLTNRPLIFASYRLTAEQIKTLCERGSVSVIGKTHFEEAGMMGGINSRASAIREPCNKP